LASKSPQTRTDIGTVQLDNGIGLGQTKNPARIREVEIK
jgi:hypothetical protein